MPAGFVYLGGIDPTIVQDIRYAGFDNFIGHPLPGYEAAECILRREVAAALRRVRADLKQMNLGLKVYDCYRPHRAVRAMWEWAYDGKAAGAAQRYFPRLRKTALFALGYIAARSDHSTGTAVDLTLIESSGEPTIDRARSGPCTGPAIARAPDNSLDMGTGYDCFDINSRTASPAVTAEQRQRRMLLVTVMARHGFKNYHREWWHFTFGKSPPPAHHDFAIRPQTTP